MDEVETVEERFEAARDLRNEARHLLGRDEERKEWEVTDVSPNRKLYVLYNTIDGHRIEVPKFVFENAIEQQYRVKGQWKYVWTSSKSKAPAYKPGTVVCFLHPDSPDREILNEIGVMGLCEADELRTLQAKRIHAQNRHPQSWAAYQEYITQKRDNDWRQQQSDATNAMLELARANAKAPAGKASA